MTSTRVVAVGTAIAVALSLAGCASGTDDAASEQNDDVATPGVEQAHNAADTMFAQMMIIHHEGAIEMADLAIERTDSAAVRTLSEAISAAQGPEIEAMESWLEAWGEDTGPTDHMEHMDHGGMEMDGLSQEEAMDELAAAPETEFDRRYLQLMIAHHEGAVMMSETHLDGGESPDALDLAQGIVEAQRDEIDAMEQMLSQG